MTTATDTLAAALADLERDGLCGCPAERLLRLAMEAHWHKIGAGDHILPDAECLFFERVEDALSAAERTPCCGVRLNPDLEGFCPSCRDHI